MEKFIFIFYSLPSEPSRIRVSSWRAMKKIGALNLSQSLWVLPMYNDVHMEIEKIKETIEKDGGSITIVHGEIKYGQVDLVSRFNNEREKEYKELLEYCAKFHEEMKKETEKKNFIFTELEENEEELNKLIRWYEKIKKRDCFNCPIGEIVKNEMEKCKRELEDFTESIYENNI